MRIRFEFSAEPFEVQSATFKVQHATCIDICLLDGPFEHLFLVVKDPEQQVRALLTWKTRTKHFTISELAESGSNNTLAGKILLGSWTITFIRPAWHTGAVELEVILRDAPPSVITPDELSVLSQQSDSVLHHAEQWYRGDLHCHSDYSDGRVSLSDICNSAEHSAFDYLAVTDHSVITTRLPHRSCLVLPATEITFDNEVHYNAYGLNQLIDYGHYFSRRDISKNTILTNLFHDLSHEGVLISINHPFSLGMTLQHDFDMRDIQLYEVINAPHLAGHPIDNDKAIRFYDFLWNQGFRLTATGGSDAHKPDGNGVYPLGKPTTSIFSRALSINGLMAGLRAGRTIISNEVDCQLHIQQGSRAVYPGDEVTGEVNFSASCSLHALCWRLMKNGNCLVEINAQTFTHTISLQKGDVIRLEARKGNEIVFFMTPIHCATVVPSEFQFAALLAQFLLTEKGELFVLA